MAKAKDIQNCGIVFGRWKLVPVDDRNWELCLWRTALDTHGNEAGKDERWYRCGQFYQYNTFGNALMYAADEELKADSLGAARDIHEALMEYRAIVSGLYEAMAGGAA